MMDTKQELEFYKREYYHLLDFVPVGIIVVSFINNTTEFHTQYVNQAFSEITGYTIKDLLDSNHWFNTLYWDENYREERQKQSRSNWHLMKHKSIKQVVKIWCKNGETKWFELVYEKNISVDLKNNSVYIICFPIDEFKRKISELESKSNLDYLTNIFNRRGILEQIEQKLMNEPENYQTIIIVIADIDYFKKVNDKFGHSCGDHVIKQVAKYLQNNLRRSDMIARWGGEEFLITFFESDILSVKKVLQRIKNDFEQYPIKWNEQELKITLTFGVAEKLTNLTFSEACDHADLALYQGKKLGRNRIITYDEINLSSG
ncbi:MAG: diguanylate cyclase [Microcystaceae cyanobacterium]